MENENQRYLVEIAYHGANYHGWQVQINAITVQELIDSSLSAVLRNEIKTLGCGRTDTGVHARQLYAHFDCPRIDDQMYDHILKGVNSILPKDIVVKAILLVSKTFHARFDAVSRSYEYHVHFQKDPFLNGLSWQLRDRPDVFAMNKAAEIMMEYRDFSCFSKAHTQVLTNNCEIYYAEWKLLDDDRLVFYISANRFLRNMVRAIVGTLIDIGHGKKTIDSIRGTIESKDRSIAGMSVPACGLYLTEVKYLNLNREI